MTLLETAHMNQKTSIGVRTGVRALQDETGQVAAEVRQLGGGNAARVARKLREISTHAAQLADIAEDVGRMHDYTETVRELVTH